MITGPISLAVCLRINLLRIKDRKPQSTKSKKLISQLSYYSTSNKKGQKEFDGSCYTLRYHNTGHGHF